MNISPVSNSAKAAKPIQHDDIIKILEKQKEYLKKQIEEVNKSEIEPKLKQEKISGINEQINQIEAQIRQYKTERLAQNVKKEEAENSSDERDSSNNKHSHSNTNNNMDADSYISSKNMISALNDYSSLKTIGRVRTSLQNELRIATNSGENPEAGHGLTERIEQLESDIYKKSCKIRSSLKRASKDIESKKATENKIKDYSDNKIEDNTIDDIKTNISSELMPQEHISQANLPNPITSQTNTLQQNIATDRDIDSSNYTAIDVYA